MGTILKAVNVSRSFKINDSTTVHALKDINIEAEEHRLIVLRGRSGSGKTTLINILGALDRPTSGSVFFDGREINTLSDIQMDKLRRYDMSFVFQSVALIPTMTAYENVEFALRLVGMPFSERSKRAKRCLVRVGLEKRMHHRPGELSGGEQQRVAIARAIASKPKLIFADEPTAALDMPTGLAVMGLFRELVHTDGLTIIMTTHDPAMMDQSDIVYTLDDGAITDKVENTANINAGLSAENEAQTARENAGGDEKDAPTDVKGADADISGSDGSRKAVSKPKKPHREKKRG